MTRRLVLLLAAALPAGIASSLAEDAPLKVGDAAPAFVAKNQDGGAVDSAELYKSGTVLLFFYPKAGTGG